MDRQTLTKIEHIMMTTKPENITPAIAKRYLAKNAHNRPLKRAAIEEYKREMLAGRWILMHQGIAFYSTGELYDGQNRLTAIIESGATVTMNVTRGVPRVGVKVNGAEITPQDVTDAGRKRSVGDQLLIHGYTNANLASAAARCIAHICAGSSKGTFPIGQASSVLALYGKEIDTIIGICGHSSATRKGATLGALAFASAGISEPEVIHRFALALSTGERIEKGMPVYALRKVLTENPLYRSTGRGSSLLVAAAVTFAAYLVIHGKTVERLNVRSTGLTYFSQNQRGRVSAVRAIIGADAGGE